MPAVLLGSPAALLPTWLRPSVCESDINHKVSRTTQGRSGSLGGMGREVGSAGRRLLHLSPAHHQGERTLAFPSFPSLSPPLLLTLRPFAGPWEA